MPQTRKAAKVSAEKYKEMNRDKQALYYKDNKATVLRNRALRKMRNNVYVKPSTIDKYELRGEIPAGYTHPTEPRKRIDLSVVEPEIDTAIARKYKSRQLTKLNELDNQIKDAIARKLKTLDDTVKGRELFPGGVITLDQTVELFGQINGFTPTTVKNYQTNLRTIFERFLKKADSTNVIKQFNQSGYVIDQILKGTQVKKGSKGKKYASYRNFLIIPVTLADHVAEFKQHLSASAYKAYKQAFEREDLMAAFRVKEAKFATEIPHLSQFHMARRLYAKYSPVSTGHLITALYTLHPALRRDWGCIRLLHNEEQWEDEDVWKKNNYLKMKSGTLVLHKFKTASKYEKIVSKLQKPLMDLIRLWVKRTGNRTFLITQLNGKAFAECVKEDADPSQASSLGNYVSTAFNRWMKNADTDKNVTINMLRQSWASFMKDKPFNERMEVARKMGHSLKTQEDVYVRPDEDEISDYTEEDGSYVFDYGEKGYPYTDKDILDGTWEDKLRQIEANPSSQKKPAAAQKKIKK